MEIDLRGRLNNVKLAHSRCLAPLFEAVVNSIHAIHERGEDRGTIAITVERTTEGVLAKDWAAQPVTGFRVTDDGVGFTDENFRSFRTSDTTLKAERGGKGVGRLLWLKAFEQAGVDSVYRGPDGKLLRRRFDFTNTAGGVERESVEPAGTASVHTTVRLSGFQKKYQDKCPRTLTALARRVIEHCLSYLLLDNCPAITLHDTADDSAIDLNKHLTSELQVAHSQARFVLAEQTFEVNHFLVAAGGEAAHRLHYCADMRSVHEEHVTGRLPNLPAHIPDPDKARSLTYLGYVSSPYLDEHVTPERTRFDLTDDAGPMFPDELAWADLSKAVVASVGTFLQPYTEPVRKAKHEQIKQYVQTKAPEFRPVFKHCPELIDPIPNGLSDDKLDVELYKADQQYAGQLRDRYQKLLADGEKKAVTMADRKAKLDTFLQEWNEAGMAKLARHVAHRKATLGLLQDRLQLDAAGKYAREEAVHEVVFPLRCTSDDVRPDGMNLWILDERLAYHYYLASDKPFTQMDAIEVDDRKRPDLLVFNKPFAFADVAPPFGSVVLVEFKRPARDDYTDDENPITQVYDYVRLIRGGSAKDHKGRPIKIADGTPFYAYVVADLTPRLVAQAEDHNLTGRPDGQGYVGFNQRLGVHVEVMSFDAMVSDARRRNARFFDELGLGKD